MTQDQWAALSQSGAEFAVGKVFNRPSQSHVPAILSCNRPVTGDHLRDELCAVLIRGDRVHLSVCNGLAETYRNRIRALLFVVLPYLQNAPLNGHCLASLGDEGLNAEVLSFCASSPDFLIPDADFLNSHAYATKREAFDSAPAWEERRDTLYWRGTDTGVWRYANIEDAPRVAVCRLAQAHPDLISAAITRTEPRPDEALKRAHYTARGYMGPVEDQAEILRYRYQIDIDGNTNAWGSLFLKLLSGSPVLKVTSEFGFRQWYYDALEPWENFIPVRPDLADLLDRLAWLKDHPAEARRIGSNGAALARSMTLQTELPKAFRTFGRLLSHNQQAAS